MGLFADHPDTVECLAWAEPRVPLSSLPRIAQDRAGLRFAARDVVADGILHARRVMVADTTDRRLLPLLREAINAELRRPAREEN